MSINNLIERTRISPAMVGAMHSPLVGATSPPSISLTFTMQSQPPDRLNWCWAAVTSSIAAFYGASISQCQVASQVINNDSNSCCGAAVNCDQAAKLDDALGKLGYLAEPRLDAPPFVSFSLVSYQLSIKRVVGVRIDYFGGGSHFVVIAGCYIASGSNYYIIGNPSDGSLTPHSESDLQNNYLSGSWGATYFTKGN